MCATKVLAAYYKELASEIMWILHERDVYFNFNKLYLTVSDR